MQVTSNYREAFLLDESKLNRLHQILLTNKPKPDDEVRIMYACQLQSGKKFLDLTQEQLLALDNTQANPIVGVYIRAAVLKRHKSESKMGEASETRTAREYTVFALGAESQCRMSFGNAPEYMSDDPSFLFARNRGIDLEVESENAVYARGISSELQEQIERCVDRSWIYKLPAASTLAPLSGVLGAALALAALLTKVSNEEHQLSSRMWLTDADVQALSKAGSDPGEVLRRQIQNLANSHAAGSGPSLLRSWKFYAGIAPLVVLLMALGVLVFSCYPPVTFRWGDMGIRHEKILERRKVLWFTVIVSVVVGMLTNVSVYGWSNLFTP